MRSARIPTAMLFFCCHKCHRCICKYLKYSGIWLDFRIVLTFQCFYPHKIDGRTGKNTLFAPSFFKKILLSTLIFHLGCDTCDSKNTKTPVHTRICARERRRLQKFSHNSRHHFPILDFSLLFVNCDSKIILEKVHVDNPKTTGHFSQNDRSLFTKRRVTFHKTTGHFSQNDGSLFIKRRVTFQKTTCRFQKTTRRLRKKSHK